MNRKRSKRANAKSRMKSTNKRERTEALKDYWYDSKSTPSWVYLLLFSCIVAMFVLGNEINATMVSTWSLWLVCTPIVMLVFLVQFRSLTALWEFMRYTFLAAVVLFLFYFWFVVMMVIAVNSYGPPQEEVRERYVTVDRWSTYRHRRTSRRTLQAHFELLGQADKVLLSGYSPGEQGNSKCLKVKFRTGYLGWGIVDSFALAPNRACR